MPLPTFDLQTRTYQKRLLASLTSWANYVWLVGTEVMAQRFYKQARPGDKVYAIALCPDPYVPYFPVCDPDPYRHSWLQLFISDQHDEQPEYRLHPVLVERKAVDMISQEYIMYRWPEQLGMIHLDIVCRECGMVNGVDGFELSVGVDACDPQMCLKALA